MGARAQRSSTSALRLVAPNLWRNRTRTTLALLSLVVAFMLFMLLRAVSSAFSAGESPEGAARLIVDAKYSILENLPVSYVGRIRDLPSVAQVAHMSWFGGFYQEPQNTFATYPVDPVAYFDTYREYEIEPEILRAFGSTRTGAVATRSLAEAYGWSKGDVIPLRGDIWPKEDGSWDWSFELVGTFEVGGRDARIFLIRYDLFNEAVASFAKDEVGWLAVRVREPEKASGVARAIDELFENSPDPTRTAGEDEYGRQFARQLGDIGAVATIILAAVFFTIVLLTGNATAQAFRERIPELATLKTMGFSDSALSALVLGESVVLCLAGALGGIVLAWMLEPVLQSSLGAEIGGFEMTVGNALFGLGLALAIGLGIGAQPAWAAHRLSIAEAFRER